MARQQTNGKTDFNPQQKGTVKQRLLVILLVATCVLVLAWSMLPQSYSTDITLIGKEKPAIALIYDSNNAASDQLMEGFSKVRGAFAGQVEFIIVDVDAPGGRQFANANGVATASALFFSSEGKKITTIYAPMEVVALDKMIRQTFSL